MEVERDLEGEKSIFNESDSFLMCIVVVGAAVVDVVCKFLLRFN